MYKLKEKEGYRKVYNVRLCKGEIFKATNDLKSLNIKLGDFTDEIIEVSENSEELIEKRKRLIARIEKKKDDIKQLNKDLVEYEELLNQHNRGELDCEYSTKYEDKEEEKNIRREKKYEKRTKTNDENKKISKQYYNSNRQASSKERYLQKQYDYHYKYFIRNSQKAPSFIMRNLQNMPNNKGYIWRNIWFYGAKPIPKIKDDKGKLVEDNTLKMHEIVGKETFIRYKDADGKWTITKKEKSKYNNHNSFRNKTKY
tara:strand:+ start:103 stop:870 length:768 start_codon:yes stop_codon:yes gene_type:complete